MGAQLGEETKEDDLLPNDQSKTMKAVVCTEYGEPSKVVKLINVPIPIPEDDQLLIEIHSAALNPSDYKLTKGWMGWLVRKSFPWILGRDFAGKVVQIGTNVNPQKLKEKGIGVGSFVCGMIDHLKHDGTLCEYMAISPDYCEVVPVDAISLNEAASMPLTAMTSYQAIMQKGCFKSGGKILILGGSSGCGVYGIQIAKLYGASTITVTSSQESLCKQLGADQVLNYKDESVPVWYEALKGQEYDLIYDCVGGKELWENAHKILKKDGWFVTIVGDDKYDGAPMSAMMLLSEANRKFWSVWGNPNYCQFLTNPPVGLRELMDAVKNGKMKAVLDPNSPYQMEQFAEMFEKQMSHTSHGKLVMQIKEIQREPNLKAIDNAGNAEVKEN